MAILDAFQGPNSNWHALTSVAAAEVLLLSLFSAVVSYFPPSATVPRFLSLLLLACLTWTMQQVIMEEMTLPHYRATLAPLLWIQLLSASDLLCLSRFAVSRDGGDQTTTSGIGTFAMRSRRAVAMVFNFRRIGTEWEAKNTPASPPSQQKHADFLARRLAVTVAAYLTMDLLTSGPQLDLNLVTPDKQSLTMRLSGTASEDLAFRLIGTISFWICTALWNLIMFNTVSIIAVSTGLGRPEDYPPLYGPIGDAFTIRGFWGNFWHQCLRRGLTQHANFITNTGLRIPHSTMLSRYMRLFLAFFISGLIHHASDLGMGLPAAEAGSLLFFVLQPLGIMLEDAVQYLTQDVGALRSLRRPIGFVWVLVFLSWSTPSWFYPQARLGLDPSGLLPVHPIGWLIKTYG